MHRRRSISIFALNKDQYLEKVSEKITNTIDQDNDKDYNPILLDKMHNKSSSEFYENSLGREKSYKMELKKPTFSDLEKQEERSIEQSLKSIENSILNQNSISFYFLVRNFFCQKQILLMGSKSDNYERSSRSINYQAQIPNKLANRVSKFIKENLLIPKNTFKILVLGSHLSGKTSFINRILELITDIPDSSNSYMSNSLNKLFETTKSINIIKKVFRSINDDSISKLELIDTNEEIGKSKIINIYMRICKSIVIMTQYSYNSIEHTKIMINMIKSLKLNKQIIVIMNGQYNEEIFEVLNSYIDEKLIYLFHLDLNMTLKTDDQLELYKIFYLLINENQKSDIDGFERFE